MCNFFSFIVTRDGRLLFTEYTSHEEIVRRAALRDVNDYLVRGEVAPATREVLYEEDLPGWYVDQLHHFEDRALAVFDRVYPAYQRLYKRLERSAAKHLRDRAALSTQNHAEEAQARRNAPYAERIGALQSTYNAAAQAYRDENGVRRGEGIKEWHARRAVHLAQVEPIKSELDRLRAERNDVLNPQLRTIQQAFYDGLDRLSLNHSRRTRAADRAYVQALQAIEGYVAERPC